ncbi:MAG: hypothetical protein IJA32_13330 [Lachnospiraceae bacterium]|nr:hypothetical protein [Lachnospiraceae bacterium]
MSRDKRIKKILAYVLLLVLAFTNIGFGREPISVYAATKYVVIYFVDNTTEQWVGNDAAVMELVDNTNGHDSYWMTQKDDVTWCVTVPESACNITFNRYSSDKSTKWNSWSAGGRDENNAYYADGAEYGHWDVVEEGENYFHAGDIIYLDLSEFSDWEKDNALMYINFSDASKEENGGNDISISNADKSLYEPQKVSDKLDEYVYQYIFTEDSEGAVNLRFWRGNADTLWNCSMVLSYEDYSNGFNCIKISGWNGTNDSLVKKEEEEIGRSITWDEMQDTDGDGVPDSYEKDNGMDIGNPDTDGDGLTDGFEILYASTNPLAFSTLENGISDADLDTDEDGLTNAEECLQGTEPLNSDTDYDGLMDGEELTVYHTDPLNPDTDGDGIKDQDEIRIGLNPLNTETFGYPDAQYQSVQKIDASDFILEEINQENENYQLTLEINTKGSAFEDILVRESAYADAMENRSILGIVPEIMYENEDNMESMTLTFTIDEKNIYEEYSSIDFKGVKRYQIFWYDEEENILIPVNTEVKEEENTISATVDEVGTYCIIDMEKWLSDLGYVIVDQNEVESFEGVVEDNTEDTTEHNMEDTTEQMVMMGLVLGGVQEKGSATSAASQEIGNLEPAMMAGGTETENESRDKIDVVINLNNNVEGLTEVEFDSIKANIEIIGRSLFYETKDVRIYVLDQHGEVVKTSFGQSYANNTIQLSSMIQKLINSEPETPYIDTQASAMLDKIELREDAFKVAVFIGNSYLTSYSGGYINKIANANIHCCIIEPYTQYGSWYYELSQATNGLLIYNYTFFSDEVLNYIYGYVPDVPISKYTMILGMSIKTIILKQELKANGTTDTDADTLTDWEEVNQAKVTVNSDGSVQLPTYKAYIDKYEGRWPLYRRWENRFVNVRDANGKTIQNILSEIYVLPALSDPTKADGDNDGILDTEEISWNGVDERYKKVGALHKDTVETLFPEIKKQEISENSPSYITIDGNDVVLHLEVVIKGDKANLAIDSLKTKVITEKENEQKKENEEQQEIDNILKRLGENITLKDLAIDGIMERWNGSYDGNRYDFYEGLKVNFKVDLRTISKPAFFVNRIELDFRDGECGISNQTRLNEKINCSRYVTIYSSYCGKDGHEGKSGKDCQEYKDNLYSVAIYEGVVAHEFGHVFGLKDMYSGANNGYEPISNEEIVYDNTNFGLPKGKGIMKVDGSACANDIEMVLQAFSENTRQYYVPNGKMYKISKAIKSSVEYTSDKDPLSKYIWNPSTYQFEKVFQVEK